MQEARQQQVQVSPLVHVEPHLLLAQVLSKPQPIHGAAACDSMHRLHDACAVWEAAVSTRCREQEWSCSMQGLRCHAQARVVPACTSGGANHGRESRSHPAR